MGRLEGRVALVTGAARGIGRAVCERLAAEGASIIATDLCGQLAGVSYATGTAENLDETLRLIGQTGAEAVGYPADVRDTAQIESVAARALERFGGIDIVCAAAGTAAFAPMWELSDDDWNIVVDTNLTGVFKTLRAAIPAMIERGKGGSLILISSTAGLRGLPNNANYVASTPCTRPLPTPRWCTTRRPTGCSGQMWRIRRRTTSPKRHPRLTRYRSPGPSPRISQRRSPGSPPTNPGT
jgi:NAD(P)-dependent dehydrogenase (short-subunit alcohol dehydrogenase family)